MANGHDPITDRIPRALALLGLVVLAVLCTALLVSVLFLAFDRPSAPQFEPPLPSGPYEPAVDCNVGDRVLYRHPRYGLVDGIVQEKQENHLHMSAPGFGMATVWIETGDVIRVLPQHAPAPIPGGRTGRVGEKK